MTTKSSKIIILAAAAFLTASAAAETQTVHLDDIKVQLFYEDSGLLSDDLTKKKDMALWNTIIGEGSSGGPAKSFLASIVLRSEPNSFLKQEVVVTIVDDRKKVKLMERRFGRLWFGKDGRLVKPVFVENRTCNPTTITVSIKRDSKQVTLPFECGE
jgi:hypothetical protein